MQAASLQEAPGGGGHCQAVSGVEPGVSIRLGKRLREQVRWPKPGPGHGGQGAAPHPQDPPVAAGLGVGQGNGGLLGNPRKGGERIIACGHR